MEKSTSPINELLTTQYHPITTEIERHGLRLWQVVRLLGGSPSEGTLSRMFRGITQMPPALEKKLADALGRIGGAA